MSYKIIKNIHLFPSLGWIDYRLGSLGALAASIVSEYSLRTLIDTSPTETSQKKRSTRGTPSADRPEEKRTLAMFLGTQTTFNYTVVQENGSILKTSHGSKIIPFPFWPQP